MPDPVGVGDVAAPVPGHGTVARDVPGLSFTRAAAMRVPAMRAALALATLACNSGNKAGGTAADTAATTNAVGATTSASTKGVATAASADVTPANAGYAGPENLVYDSVADVYLVSNVNGGPVARDANGFVSRVDSAGHVIAQKWIDGTHASTRLDAPKGLAIHGDTLVIADVGVVRLFNRRTGAAVGVWQTPGVLLNDVSFAPDGTLYVTDTQGRDSVGAIYHFDRAGHATRLAHGDSLGGPDGIVALPGGGVMYATFGADRVARVAPSGGVTPVVTLPGKKVDGLRRLADGSYIVTSWDAHSAFHLLANGALDPLLTGVTSPAGVAIDTRHHRLAVTSMNDNKMYLVTFP